MLDLSIQESAGLAAAPPAAEAEALTAAGTFGAALRGSPEFAALLAANDALTADAEATAAIQAFGTRQEELRTELMMGVLSDAQRAELERLRETMVAVPSVASYVSATAAFQAACRETALVVSTQIGIDFAANCRSGGCCGIEGRAMLSTDINEAALAFGRTLRQAPAVAIYRRAAGALDADPVAQGLLADLREHQGSLARMQRAGLTSSQEQIDRMRLCQAAVRGNEAIMTHLRATNEVQAYLPEVAREVSTALGADYGSLVAPTSC